MADPEKPPPAYAESTTPTQTQSAGAVTINVSYVKSPRGILKIVEIFLLMIAFSCLADACSGRMLWPLCPDSGRYSFFMFSTVVPWLICIVIFILLFFCINEHIPQVNWNLTVLLNSIVWAILLLISSSLIADDIRKRNEFASSYIYTRVSVVDNKEYAAVVFGFFAIIAFIIDIAFHFKLVRL